MLVKIISTLTVCLFACTSIITPEDVHALSAVSLFETVDGRRKLEVELLAQHTDIIFAVPGTKDASYLANNNGAEALLVSGAKVLARSHLKNDHLKLLRILHHEKTEALMQALERYDRTRYRGIKELIQPREAIRKAYFDLFEPAFTPDLSPELLLNDMVAKAFELIVLVDKKMMTVREMSPRERTFYDAIRPIIDARHDYFSEVFWDTHAREVTIRAALATGLPLYQAASSGLSQEKKAVSAAGGEGPGIAGQGAEERKDLLKDGRAPAVRHAQGALGRRMEKIYTWEREAAGGGGDSEAYLRRIVERYARLVAPGSGKYDLGEAVLIENSLLRILLAGEGRIREAMADLIDHGGYAESARKALAKMVEFARAHQVGEAAVPAIKEDRGRFLLTADERARFAPRYQGGFEELLREHGGSWDDYIGQLAPDDKLVVFVRHIEAISNIRQTIQSDTSYSPGTAYGDRQRAALAGYLGDRYVAFDWYGSSGLERAYVTLSSILPEGAPRAILPILNELSIFPGGHDYAEVMPLYKRIARRFYESPLDFAGPDRSMRDIENGLRELYHRTFPADTVHRTFVAAAHGRSIEMSLAAMFGISLDKYADLISTVGNLPNVSLTVAKYDAARKRWELLVYGDNAYLPQHLRNGTKGAWARGYEKVRAAGIAIVRALRYALSGRTLAGVTDYLPSIKYFLPFSRPTLRAQVDAILKRTPARHDRPDFDDTADMIEGVAENMPLFDIRTGAFRSAFKTTDTIIAVSNRPCKGLLEDIGSLPRKDARYWEALAALSYNANLLAYTEVLGKYRSMIDPGKKKDLSYILRCMQFHALAQGGLSATEGQYIVRRTWEGRGDGTFAVIGEELEKFRKEHPEETFVIADIAVSDGTTSLELARHFEGRNVRVVAYDNLTRLRMRECRSRDGEPAVLFFNNEGDTIQIVEKGSYRLLMPRELDAESEQWLRSLRERVGDMREAGDIPGKGLSLLAPEAEDFAAAHPDLLRFRTHDVFTPFHPGSEVGFIRILGLLMRGRSAYFGDAKIRSAVSMLAGPLREGCTLLNGCYDGRRNTLSYDLFARNGQNLVRDGARSRGPGFNRLSSRSWRTIRIGAANDRSARSDAVVAFADGSKIHADFDEATGELVGETVIDRFRAADGTTRILAARRYSRGHRLDTATWYDDKGAISKVEGPGGYSLYAGPATRWLDVNTFNIVPLLREAIGPARLTQQAEDEIAAFAGALFEGDLPEYLNGFKYLKGYPHLCYAVSERIYRTLKAHKISAQVVVYRGAQGGAHYVVEASVGSELFIIDGAATQFEPLVSVIKRLEREALPTDFRQVGLAVVPARIASQLPLTEGVYTSPGGKIFAMSYDARTGRETKAAPGSVENLLDARNRPPHGPSRADAWSGFANALVAAYSYSAVKIGEWWTARRQSGAEKSVRAGAAVAGIVFGVVVAEIALRQLTGGFSLWQYYISLYNRPGIASLVASGATALILGTGARVMGMYLSDTRTRRSIPIITAIFLLQLVWRPIVGVLTDLSFWAIEENVDLPLLRALTSLGCGFVMSAVFDLFEPMFLAGLDARIHERSGDIEKAQELRREVNIRHQWERVKTGIMARIVSSYFQHDLTQNLVSREYRVLVLFTMGFFNNTFRSLVAFTRKPTMSPVRVFAWGAMFASFSGVLIAPLNGLAGLIMAVVSAAYFKKDPFVKTLKEWWAAQQRVGIVAPGFGGMAPGPDKEEAGGAAFTDEITGWARGEHLPERLLEKIEASAIVPAPVTTTAPSLVPYRPLPQYAITDGRPKGVVVIGAGHIGPRHLAAMPNALACLSGEAHVSIIGLVDNDPDDRRFASKARSVAHLFETVNRGLQAPPAFRSIDEALRYAREKQSLAPEDVIALVCVPNEHHFAVSEDLAARGVRMICVEKPLANTLHDIDRIISLRDDKGLRIACVTQFPFSLAFQRVLSFIESRRQAGIRPTAWETFYSKDRLTGAQAGKNVGDPHIFLYESIHQLAMAAQISPIERVTNAYAEDAVFDDGRPALAFHARGALATEHRDIRAVNYTDFSKPGITEKQKIFNIRFDDGSVLAVNFAPDHGYMSHFVYHGPQGGILEDFVVDETVVDMLVLGDAAWLYALLSGNEAVPYAVFNGTTDATSLGFHRELMSAIHDGIAASRASAGPPAPPSSLDPLFLFDLVMRADGNPVSLGGECTMEEMFGGPRKDLQGKDVLILACGGGAYCFAAALAGARRSVGVDSDGRSIEAARLLGRHIHKPQLRGDLIAALPRLEITAITDVLASASSGAVEVGTAGSATSPVGLEFIETNAARLSMLADDSFDAVAVPHLIGVENGVRDEYGMTEILHEAIRVLRPDGTLFITPYVHPNAWGDMSIRYSLMRSMRFENYSAMSELLSILAVLELEGYGAKKLVPVPNKTGLFRVQADEPASPTIVPGPENAVPGSQLLVPGKEMPPSVIARSPSAGLRTTEQPLPENESIATEIASLAQDSKATALARNDGVRASEEDVDARYDAQMSDASVVAASYKEKGQSLILYADDIVHTAAMVDLENAVKKILGEQKMLEGGKIILFAKEKGNAFAVEQLIRQADGTIDVVTVTQDELIDPKSQASTSDAKLTEELLRFARRKGAKDVLAIIRGSTNAPEELAALSKAKQVPIVLVGVERAFYSFAEAIVAAIRIRQSRGADGWLIVLPPVRTITAELEVMYEKHLQSLVALVAA